MNEKVPSVGRGYMTGLEEKSKDRFGSVMIC